MGGSARGHKIIRDGVHRVYAVRWQRSGTAEAVFCYGNGSYGKLPPFEARYDGSRPNKSFEHVQGDWRTEDLLMHAPVASQSYLGLSLTLPWKSA